MEQNSLTLEERKSLDFFCHCQIQELSPAQLLYFRQLLEKHQLTEAVQCLAN